MIISPAQDLPLPKDIQKALKDAQNSVTLSEAEHRRLVELRVAEETVIVELAKRKAYEESEIARLSAQLTLLEVKVAKLKLEEGVICEEMVAQNIQLLIDRKVIETKEKECLKVENELSTWSNSLTKLQDEVDKRELEVSKREMTIKTKEEKFTNFIKTL